MWLHMFECEPRTGVQDTGYHMQAREEGIGNSFDQGQDCHRLASVGIKHYPERLLVHEGSWPSIGTSFRSCCSPVTCRDSNAKTLVWTCPWVLKDLWVHCVPWAAPGLRNPLMVLGALIVLSVRGWWRGASSSCLEPAYYLRLLLPGGQGMGSKTWNTSSEF